MDNHHKCMRLQSPLLPRSFASRDVELAATPGEKCYYTSKPMVVTDGLDDPSLGTRRRIHEINSAFRLPEFLLWDHSPSPWTDVLTSPD